MNDIKPHIDDDGVPWCDAECPQWNPEEYQCNVDESYLLGEQDTVICPHHVKRMAEALREVINCGVSFEDGRVRYIEIQISKDEMADIRALLGATDKSAEQGGE